ncbi:DEAD/DEAH box helicase [Roseibacillus persicicus]|uniref:DEAD/DEAH box helicase n=1 Tax=Roseibacillus persicicus TaxID=454148 RepID=UPI00280F8255|nr:DEAD/DEAH box helicase [Roseibacillus persicicus]MDQ8190485.1 DEAD/DEAH box helicase [Roseibacillus persicicus]
MSKTLQPFLAGQSWLHRFDDHVLVMGKKLAKKPLLPDLALDEAEDGSVQITATCEGESVEVNLWPEGPGDWDLDTLCTCDHGHFCPHAAAALFLTAKPNTFSRLLRETHPAIEEPTPNRPPEPPSPAPDSQPSPAAKPSFHLHLTPEPVASKVTRLLLQALRQQDREVWLVARPTVQYGDSSLPLSSLPQESPIPRDPALERRALEQLTTLGLTSIAAQPSFRFLLGLAAKNQPEGELAPEASAFFPEPYHTTPDLYWPWFRATAIPKLEAAGWTVTVEPDFGHHLYEVSSSDLEARLDELPGGWFTLSVGFDVDGESLDLLPILLKLLEGDTLDQLATKAPDARHLVYLPNGSALHLPVDRLRQILNHLSVVLDPDFPIHPLDAAAIAEEFDIKTTAPSLRVLRKNLSEQKEASKKEKPAGLQADLRPYQQVGYEWMATLAENDLHGVLADDMGLGKTMQTLALLLETKGDETMPSLVVAPTSVVPNWAAEAKKFAPSLRVLTLSGPKRAKAYPAIPHADIVLTSFALLQRDIEKLKKHSFKFAILDEAQLIKNPQAKVSVAARQLKAQHRLCLSGTPVENNLTELWSLFHFLIPGFLGDLNAFRTRYQNPIEKEDDLERRDALRARLAPLILRRTKDEVAKDLPPKTILVHPIELTTQQKDLYESVRVTMDKRVRDAITARGLSQSQITILDALLKLRQICCHPDLVSGGDFLTADSKEKDGKPCPSAKLVYLFELLEILFSEGRRVLLFSQFTSMLQLIENELIARKVSYLKLTGASQDRGGLVEKFQNNDIPIFLISLKAGGTGLNLTAADTVIHYDPWWNPAAEAQATDRAYRIGQTKPVFVHKLLCANTVEDRIHRLQQQKAHLADSILSAASQGVPDSETLAQLLAPLG